MNSLKIFSGNSNVALAEAIVKDLGITMGAAKIGVFSDDEIEVNINESVRGMDVFVIQSTCTPGNKNLMELLIMIDALKRASAARITAVLPYYGYARQDRKVSPRAPITAKLVADLITAAGANRILTMDLHAGQIQGFFNIPVDHLFAMPVLLKYIKERYQNNLVIVSPDAGGVERARAFAKRLNAKLAIINKSREEPNKAKFMELIGNVRGMTALILDDIVDTVGTIIEAAEALLAEGNGAIEILACGTHPVFSGPAYENIQNSLIKKLVVTDTISLNDRFKFCDKVKVVSVAPLIADAVRRIHNNDSVSSLFI